ncbi:MAG TPA: AAA family ATPase [Vicinamibacterales bacterium]|nr:AAA family ATPase [Vicinamibacterales bacterium]
MYQRFYGLTQLPFELTPNPKFLFLTPGHREALSTLHYAVRSGKSLTVLLGEAGTGKTTLLRTVLESEEYSHIRWVSLNNPVLTRADFIRTLAARFALGPEAAGSKARFLDAFERVLRERRSRGETSVLVVDEAQSLSYELLEELRLLANIETQTEKLLLLILAGQPEFALRLNQSGLRQLKQRVALRCEIARFDLAETAAYIASRVSTAGGDSARLFSREAVLAIHQCSRGIPRTINVICDNALLGGFGVGRQPVGRQIVMDVVGDFDLGSERTPVVPPAQADPPPAPETTTRDASQDAGDHETSSHGLFEHYVSPRRFAFFGTTGR